MGVIQNAINQVLGTAGIAARLSPEYETKQELYRLGKKESALSMQRKALGPIDVDELEEGKTIQAKQHHEILEKEAEVAQRQFELKPTKESRKKATFARSAAGQGPIATFKADPEEIMQEAMQKVATKQEAQLKQRRNFMNYLKTQPTSFGGTVGDLPMNVQKEIAKGYSKTERKNLMDMMDKEGKK